MSTTMFLSALLMLRGLDGAAGSDLQVNGKLIHSTQTLLSSEDGRHSVRKQQHHEANNEISRSLDHKSYKVHVTPTTSRISLPTIIRLYPQAAKTPQRHTNMPMRFGREINPGDDRAPNSTPNMPQRFGRSWEVNRMCAECTGVQEAPNPVLSERLEKTIHFWSLLKTLASQQFLNTGITDYDKTANCHPGIPSETL
uniref:Uncharacterized protein n=1 Tax=Echeneis naucrates TaxID=173247 RepID=A0A665WGW5_ECHNA